MLSAICCALTGVSTPTKTAQEFVTAVSPDEVAATYAFLQYSRDMAQHAVPSLVPGWVIRHARETLTCRDDCSRLSAELKSITFLLATSAPLLKAVTPSLRTVGSAPEVAFFVSGPRSRAAEATPP
jgi:hypothetical protein